MTPLGLGLSIEHDETATPEFSGNDEGKGAIFDLTGIHDAIVAEMSPGGRDGLATKAVIDDFAPGTRERVHRVGTGLPTHDHAEHEFVIEDVAAISLF